MKKPRFRETQIVSILKEADAGMKVDWLLSSLAKRKYAQEKYCFFVSEGKLYSGLWGY